MTINRKLQQQLSQFSCAHWLIISSCYSVEEYAVVLLNCPIIMFLRSIHPTTEMADIKFEPWRGGQTCLFGKPFEIASQIHVKSILFHTFRAGVHCEKWRTFPLLYFAPPCFFALRRSNFPFRKQAKPFS